MSRNPMIDHWRMSLVVEEVHFPHRNAVFGEHVVSHEKCFYENVWDFVTSPGLVVRHDSGSPV